MRRMEPIVREMWELPSSTVKTKLIRSGVVLALVWALVAAPLTVWLAVRTEPAPPPPPDRELTVTEKLAATLVSERLSQGYITLTHQVTTPVAKFEVTEAVQAASGDSIGTVKSGSETAELLVAAGSTFLRANSAFWSTSGVPTSFVGWVDIGNQLGRIQFPLKEAVAGIAPSPQSRIETATPDPSIAVYRNGNVTAQLVDKGVVQLSVAERTATSSRAEDTTARLQTAITEVEVPGRLEGTSGGLTVSEPAPAPPPPPAP